MQCICSIISFVALDIVCHNLSLEVTRYSEWQRIYLGSIHSRLEHIIPFFMSFSYWYCELCLGKLQTFYLRMQDDTVTK
jgi:hypothetical protein